MHGLVVVSDSLFGVENDRETEYLDDERRKGRCLSREFREREDWKVTNHNTGSERKSELFVHIEQRHRIRQHPHVF
jgi:hypothetical protein